ncbi:flavodoxin family protein [Pectobacteriaceae bacterium CE70]|uniref:Flavoprotein WrbA n=1 Tax=Serratia sp. (strain ATCC 39006) TaxID=104623 RepID=A0A2I5T6X8_SERS3|nr:flavodoxin family protein [Serratia sp. ATCC 39006]WJV60982.1 flavodoxin family protein [Pectobacteriaceae bacterium C52]WJV68562.1 flavodoxin family protein [Pectobacteriaceae bacterium CE70]WJY12493.1 flavodoxin family protein [Pectobacteriaceae bacterium C80]AUH00317.1 flavodoxin family protein [Serratia sp. ATCC 39006]AUH04637.1 flavodoxin family protein [Serratia sp. ATCC 39006]
MSKIAVIYFSGYGHTKLVAEIVAESAEATLIAIDNNGDITEDDWQTLNNADGIIFGSPAYMGSVPWQFKKFADASSKVWSQSGWKDKVFGGFVNSASLNGDKQVCMIYLQTLASQHGGIWVSLGLLPANTQAATRNDINNLGGSVGALIQSPSDAGADAIPAGDLDTAKLYGARVAEIAQRLNS